MTHFFTPSNWLLRTQLSLHAHTLIPCSCEIPDDTAQLPSVKAHAVLQRSSFIYSPVLRRLSCAGRFGHQVKQGRSHRPTERRRRCHTTLASTDPSVSCCLAFPFLFVPSPLRSKHRLIIVSFVSGGTAPAQKGAFFPFLQGASIPVQFRFLFASFVPSKHEFFWVNDHSSELNSISPQRYSF